MEVIAHRGFWVEESEKNTKIAFQRAVENGFGIETDFRDLRGELVISHDMPTGGEMTAEDFFGLYTGMKGQGSIAVNVKADGLQSLLLEKIKQFNIDKYFVFDMSVPDTLGYIKLGMKVYTRESEYEIAPPFFEEVAGVWLDQFISDWVNPETLVKYRSAGKSLAVVSPELHKREIGNFWEVLKECESVYPNVSFSICTDKPMQAMEFFNA